MAASVKRILDSKCPSLMLSIASPQSRIVIFMPVDHSGCIQSQSRPGWLLPLLRRFSVDARERRRGAKAVLDPRQTGARDRYTAARVVVIPARRRAYGGRLG